MARLLDLYCGVLRVTIAVCLAAMGQSLSVEKLLSFLQSSEKLIKEGKMTDRELAGYLTRVKLTERLDDRTIEELQGSVALGPKTLEALHSLRDIDHSAFTQVIRFLFEG